MIFVTVGTHEQGMDRLFKELDRLIESGRITDEVFAQIGYTEYKPKNFKYKELICYDEMDEMVKKASIIITHGGPGSIFHAIQNGKVPIVVPRNPEFNEHVDNHQILFTKRLKEGNRILAVYDILKLDEIIKNYSLLIKECGTENSNSYEFIKKFDEIIYKKLNLRR